MATEILRPNANGDYTNWTTQYPGTGDFWDKVDEEEADDAGTYIKNQLPVDEEVAGVFELEDTSISAGSTINSITVHFRVRSPEAGASNSHRPRLRLGTDETVGTLINHTTSWVTYSEVLSRPGGGSWAVSDLNSLQAGWSAIATATYEENLTQLYVEVDYTPLITKTSSDSGSGVEALGSKIFGAVEIGSGVEALSSRLFGAAEIGSGIEALLLAAALTRAEAGVGIDAYISLLQLYEKFGSDSGIGIDALRARLFAADDSGSALEVILLINALLSADSGLGAELSALMKALLAIDLGIGSDRLVAKIESPTLGGDIRLPPGIPREVSIPSKEVSLPSKEVSL